jgi:hypothetical protein
VVAAGDHFDTLREQILRNPRRDAEAGSGVFAVGDAQIDPPLRKDIRQPLVNDFAAGGADNVADEEDSQGMSFPKKIASLGSSAAAESLGITMLVAS